MNAPIPKWIVIVAGFIALLGFLVGGSLYLTPGTFIDNVDFSLIGSRYLANMWAARQIAIAAIIGFSLLRKSREMLKVSLLAYCLMNIQDVAIGIWLKDSGLMIGASIAMILSGAMVVVLFRKTTNG